MTLSMRTTPSPLVRCSRPLVTQINRLKSLTLIPVDAGKTLDLFLQIADDPLDVAAPDAAGYEFQSHGIIEMLEQLLDKFIDKRIET